MSLKIDGVFDLDLALTVVEEYSSAAAELPEPLPVTSDDHIEMPTVSAVGFCAICMEEFQAEVGAKQVPCGHLFHSSCLTNWLSLRKSCPLCRFCVSAATT
ncbi:hypothetical protein RND71_008389 [Anisodus tanguticus]|uniref:RING-type E3 ubiquitin transferase n=1 Tax=Anisodus tanguticus TaxID=243964 RepID=A0AAE1SN57_9SOLA|nr:hypothetical protein RND71_008389 [Anisodus tanguticus]